LSISSLKWNFLQCTVGLKAGERVSAILNTRANLRSFGELAHIILHCP
jgi:hypothetical protein